MIILYYLKISIINSSVAYRLLGCLLLFIAVGGCHSRQEKLFTLLSDSGIEFENRVIDSKDDNSFYFRNFYNGGGVAIADINNDGLADVLMTSNMGENKLYLNKGGMKFEDITSRSGMVQDSMWNTGAVMVDINNDGWLDIYICSSGHINSGRRINKLYINNHNLSFTEKGKEFGLDASGYCTQASFFDYDLDGDLDCLLINNSPLPFSSLNYATMRDTEIAKWNVADNLKGGGNHLYKNENNHFTEVTAAAGLHAGLISFGLGVSVGDINNDNYPDIYVGNDFIEKDYLYINQKDGTFKDDLENCISQISMSSMSSDLADINNDGHPEIFTTDMIPDNDYRLKTTGTFDNIDLYVSKQKAGLYHQYVKNSLQLNNGNGTFSEIANLSGIAGTDWSWGAVFFDADNDGYNDLFVCNGINRDVGDLDFLDYFSNDFYQQMVASGKKTELDELLKHIPVTPLSNRVFKNNGRLQFKDVEKEWGMDTPSFSNSVAYADLDNDGDLDVIVNNENSKAFVYRNNSNSTDRSSNHYLAVQLSGDNNNRFAVGSKIFAYVDSQIMYREVVPTRGFQSSVDYKQVIGLGIHKKIDSLVIIWPGLRTTRLTNVTTDTLLKLDYSSSRIMIRADTTSAVTSLVNEFDRHQEDEYLDYYYERNLPELLSAEGPHITSADVNGDGLEDLFIGGAKGQAGQLYLHTNAGYKKSIQKSFDEFAAFEDVAVLFFDADKDGDADLFIGSGGNNVEAGSRELQHRLYINDGKGGFTLDARAFPANNFNTAVALAYDYDHDGDEDLFIGARSTPFQYGMLPYSSILNNDGKGHFTDLTLTQAKAFAQLGMITAAVWVDIDNDKTKELVITGEWMHTRIFHYMGASNSFEELKNTGLENLDGWWQSLRSADLNNDGNADLVIGNVGNNFYLHAQRDAPVKLWVADFDQNGTQEQMLTKTVDGKDMPVFLKREMNDQFPLLKKQNLRHSEFATKSITDIFTPALISKIKPAQFNFSSSVIAWSDGRGHFTIEELPVTTQLSSINAINISDVNNDHLPDIMFGGNMYGFPPQFGRLDASYGGLLLNLGKKKFRSMSAVESGISVKGQVKDIAEIKRNGQSSFLFLINNDKPVEIRVKGK